MLYVRYFTVNVDWHTAEHPVAFFILCIRIRCPVISITIRLRIYKGWTK